MTTYVSLNDYKQGLEKMDCDELNRHDPNKAKVPAEPFIIKKVYNEVKKRKCGSSANDKVAVEFAIKHIGKIADELDENGFVGLANILDDVLKKFSNMNCKNCK